MKKKAERDLKERNIILFALQGVWDSSLASSSARVAHWKLLTIGPFSLMFAGNCDFCDSRERKSLTGVCTCMHTHTQRHTHKYTHTHRSEGKMVKEENSAKKILLIML